MNFEDEPVPGYPLPILPGHTSPGRFERVLRAGAFAVTTELAPPDSADPDDVYRRARVFDGYVDAINATDGSGANCHMSSLAVCALLTRVGYAPVMQISCRDRNRIAIQGDILGGAAMGVCNMLCLTGDGVQAGDHPQAKPVFDLDTRLAARHRARRCATTITSRAAARSRSRRACSSAPPRIRSRRRSSWRPQRLAKKIAAGAQFIQTQYCYDVPLLRRFMTAVEDARAARQGFHPGRRRAAALGEGRGMDAHARAGHPHSGRRHRAPRGRAGSGARRPQPLHRADPGDPRDPGVHGVHVMAYRQEESVAEVIDRSGVLAGRTPWYPGTRHRRPTSARRHPS